MPVQPRSLNLISLKFKAKGITLMFSIEAKNAQKTGCFSIAVDRSKERDVCELSKNLLQAIGTA
jgi:hypothetical protein